MGPPPLRDALLRDGRALAVALVVACSLASLFTGLGAASLWEPDEPRFAEASRQMLERGDYLTPWFDGEPRLQKPILIYWLQIASYRLFGVSELAARLPVALCGLGALLCLMLLGRTLAGARVGLLAALALATTFRFVVYSRHALTDVPLLLFMLGALCGFARALAAPAGRSRAPALVGWLSLGLGFLTKGPVGLLPLGIWALFLLATRERAGLARLHAAAGLPLALAVALPWYAWTWATHRQLFLEQVLLTEVARVASDTLPGPARGVFWYLKVWPSDVAPWTPHVLAAIALAALSWRALEPRIRRTATLCFIWIALLFVVFSAAHYKLPHYLLPIYPAMALLVGLLLDRAAAEPTGVARRLASLATWATALVYLGAAVAAAAFLTRALGNPLLSADLIAPALLAAGGVAAIVAERRRRPLAAFGALVASIAVAYGCLAAITVPRDLERFKPARSLGETIARVAPPGARVALYGLRAQGLVFYARRPIETLHTAEQVASFLRDQEPRFCVLRNFELAEIEALYGAPLRVLDERPIFAVNLRQVIDGAPDAGRKTYVLVTNDAATSALAR